MRASSFETQLHLPKMILAEDGCNQSSKIGHFSPQTIPLFSRSLSVVDCDPIKSIFCA